MPIGMIFWMLMIIWALFGLWWNSNPGAAWGQWGNHLLLFVLFFILGWHAFGFVVHQ
jgi:hypothetical protein